MWTLARVHRSPVHAGKVSSSTREAIDALYGCMGRHQTWMKRAAEGKEIQEAMLSSCREAAELAKQHNLSSMMLSEVCRTSSTRICSLTIVNIEIAPKS